MVNISRNRFLFINILSLAGIGILGTAGYRYLISFNKADAETFLFSALILSLIIILLFSHALIKSRNISREMEKLIHLSSIGGFTPGTSLKRLGKLGEQINDLYFHLNSMSKKRSIKITSQSALIDFITTNAQIPVVTTDSTGKILYVSKALIDKNNTTKNDIIDKGIVHLLPNIKITAVYHEMTIAHTLLKYSGDKEPVEIYPVTGDGNEIAYLVFVFGKHMIQQTHVKETKPKSIYSFLKRVVSR